MKVLCIKDSPNFAHTKRGIITVSESLRVKCGLLYTVKQEVTGYQGEKKWVLEEKPTNCRYKKEYFSLVSEVEELEEVYEKENIKNKNKTNHKGWLIHADTKNLRRKYERI